MEENQQKANELIQQGNEFFQNKLWLQAANCYEKAIALFTAYGTFYLVVGECYFKDRNYEAAENAFKRLLDSFPEHDQGWWMLGQAVMMLQRFPEAEEFYDKAIELGTTDVEPYYYGAQIKHLNGKKEEVLPLIQKIRETHPNWIKYAVEDPILGEYVGD